MNTSNSKRFLTFISFSLLSIVKLVSGDFFQTFPETLFALIAPALDLTIKRVTRIKVAVALYGQVKPDACGCRGFPVDHHFNSLCALRFESSPL